MRWTADGDVPVVGNPTDESVIWAAYAKAKGTVKPQVPLLAPPGLQYKSWPTDIYFKPEQLTVPAVTATLPSRFVISVQPVARVVTFDPGTSDEPIASRSPRSKPSTRNTPRASGFKDCRFSCRSRRVG